jgi:hypothetical protein
MFSEWANGSGIERENELGARQRENEQSNEMNLEERTNGVELSNAVSINEIRIVESCEHGFPLPRI